VFTRAYGTYPEPGESHQKFIALFPQDPLYYWVVLPYRYKTMFLKFYKPFGR